MIKLISVTPVPDYKLHLRFFNGVEGTVDLKPLVGQGVFCLWNNSAAFENVKVSADGAVRWNDEVELCADALYLQITGKTSTQLFSEPSEAALNA